MGILVANGTLPNGIQVSNVYMSFCQENITTQSVPIANNFMVSACYRVFADPSRQKGSNIRIPIVIVLPQSDMESHPYTYLYAELKKLYPDSIDWTENAPPPTTPF
jgi:hypothetical protein